MLGSFVFISLLFFFPYPLRLSCFSPLRSVTFPHIYYYFSILRSLSLLLLLCPSLILSHCRNRVMTMMMMMMMMRTEDGERGDKYRGSLTFSWMNQDSHYSHYSETVSSLKLRHTHTFFITCIYLPEFYPNLNSYLP